MSKGSRKSLFLLMLLTLLCVVGLGTYKMYSNRKNVIISHESGIYQDAIEISVRTIMPCTILYTTNGETPMPDDSDTAIYSDSLL